MEEKIERFREMVASLEANPNIFVVLFECNPGIPKAQQVSIWKKFQMEAVIPLSEFARAANGLSLWWIHTKNPKFNARKLEKAKQDYLKSGKVPAFEIVETCDGMISIGGLAYILNPNYSRSLFDEPGTPDGQILNGKNLFPNDVQKHIRNLDEFSDEEEHIAVSLDPIC
jgi:hypothetical protein